MINRIFKRFITFLYNQKIPGILMLSFGALAMVLNNTEYANWYINLLTKKIKMDLAVYSLDKTILLWINDGLMALFFLLIGLEMKREILIGNLTSIKKAILPIVSAFGGVLVPAAIFIYLNIDNSIALKGWAIPVATDVAFALGILALVGNRIPWCLRVLLVTIAIFDDLMAILIIAVFYTDNLQYIWLLSSLLMFFSLVIVNYFEVVRLWGYAVLGVVLWACLIKSGVHSTLAGVLLAMTIPLKSVRPGKPPLLIELESFLYPWVNFIILPIFAFANAGVPLTGLSLKHLLEPIPLGIAMGLFVGKQVGIFSFSWLSIKLKIANLPVGLNWRHLYGMSLLCGIGFTMSLFIGALSYPNNAEYEIISRAGILLGSTLSALFGYAFLAKFCN